MVVYVVVCAQRKGDWKLDIDLDIANLELSGECEGLMLLCYDDVGRFCHYDVAVAV